MSAINEALKKARDQNPATTSSTGNNGFHLLPVTAAKPVSHDSLMWSLSLVLATALVGMGVYLMKDERAQVVNSVPTPIQAIITSPSEQPPASDPMISQTEGIATVGHLDNDVTSWSSLDEPRRSTAPSDSSTATVTSTPTPNSNSISNTHGAEAASAYPKLRLQGIFYREGDPFVILNSQTLTVGDEVEEVTVTKITPATVVLRWNDQIKTLTLR